MFSLEMNFIRKELPEATVISRRTQLIKRTPFVIRRRRDDDKINYAELQLRITTTNYNYELQLQTFTDATTKTCDTQKNRKMLTIFIFRHENVALKVEIFQLPYDMCTKQQSRK